MAKCKFRHVPITRAYKEADDALTKALLEGNGIEQERAKFQEEAHRSASELANIHDQLDKMGFSFSTGEKGNTIKIIKMEPIGMCKSCREPIRWNQRIVEDELFQYHKNGKCDACLKNGGK